MNKLLLIVLALAAPLFPAASFAQYVVTAPSTDSILQINNNQQLLKWAEQLDKMTTSISKLDQQLQTLNKVKDVVGDPTQAGNLIGLGNLTGSLQNSGVGKLASSISQGADGVQSLRENGQGLYKDIPTNLPDGGNILRDLTKYKKFSAVEKSKSNFDSVFDEAVKEIKKLDSEITSTSNQLKSASTQAEVEKLNGKLSALHAAKDSWEGRKRDAIDQLSAQKIANDSDKEKQEQAQRENAEADTIEAFENIKGAKRW